MAFAINRNSGVFGVVVLLAVISLAAGHVPRARSADDYDDEGKQFLTIGKAKETSTAEFVRLVVMRFIYGLASTMGVEDRLEGVLNGVFVPPNAEDDLFGLGGFADGDGDDYGGGDGLGDLFDDGL